MFATGPEADARLPPTTGGGERPLLGPRQMSAPGPISDVASGSSELQSPRMKLDRLIVVFGCAALLSGVTGRASAQEPDQLASLLVIPANSPVHLRAVSEGDADFTGRFVLTGRFRYGCTDECLKPFPRQEMRLDFFPDDELSARLPHWRGYMSPPIIEIENSEAFAAKVIRPATMRRLQFGRLNWVEGRISIVVDAFRTGIACDSAWYLARFVEVAKPPSFQAAHSESGGCE